MPYQGAFQIGGEIPEAQRTRRRTERLFEKLSPHPKLFPQGGRGLACALFSLPLVGEGPGMGGEKSFQPLSPRPPFPARREGTARRASAKQG